MTQTATCGKGLAERAVLPRRLAELADAMANVLEHHQTSFGSDANSRPELEAYATLTKEFRSAAQMLSAIAARMEGYRDLPMATHDEATLGGKRSIEVFRDFVGSERALLELLQDSLKRDEQMLDHDPETSRIDAR